MKQDIGLKLERKAQEAKQKTMPRHDPQGQEWAKARIIKYIHQIAWFFFKSTWALFTSKFFL
jgi:hypothetical protein